jgi:hypothetical protein
MKMTCEVAKAPIATVNSERGRADDPASALETDNGAVSWARGGSAKLGAQ